MSARKFVRSLIGGLVATCALATAATAQTTYNLSTAVDFTGPFADVMPSWHSGHRAMVAWWNDTKGKELGVKVDLKVYDMRYDTSVVAKTWPSILASDTPIAHLGMGTPDLVGLMKRLPDDKVFMMMPTAMVGLVWVPNGWHFAARPTYSHEMGALFAHLQSQLQPARALKIGTVSTQGLAGYEDQVNGIDKLAKTYPDRFEVVGKAWVDNQPVNISNEIRRLAASKPDVIMVGTNTAQVVATIRALRELNLKIPVAMSSHNGLSEAAKTIALRDLEGSFSVFSFAPYMQKDLPARDAYMKAKTGDGTWGLAAAQSAAQTLVVLRTLERAVAKVGAKGVTSQVMYDALMSGPFTEQDTLGLTPAIQFDKTAPFPVGDIKAKALVVRNGEIVPLTETWLDAPKLEKW